MTQSGQGEEPSAQPAHEGIVLPSDGGEPLLPGMTHVPTPAAPATPAGGQAWGGSWGPGPGQEPAPQAGQGWSPAPAQQWHTPEQAPAAGGPGPLPPEGAQGQSYDAQPYAIPAPGYGQDGQAPGYGQDGQASAYGPQTGYGPGGQPGYGGPGGQPGYGGADGQPPYGGGEPYGKPYGQQPYAGHELPGGPGAAAPLPPALPDAYGSPSAPLPPEADGATQYIPPVPAGPGGTQPPAYPQAVPGAAPEGAAPYLPPAPAGGADEGATQYIPPVGPGALPPEAAGEETRFLGRAQQPPATAGHPDAEATQYIPPVPGGAPGGDRQPPAEFDNLFRSGPAADDSPAGATQQMPRIQPDAYAGPTQPTPPGMPTQGMQMSQGMPSQGVPMSQGMPSQGVPMSQGMPSQGVPMSQGMPTDSMGYDGGRRGSGRTGSRVPLIAAIGVGIAVVGIGAGALLSGGGGDKGDDSKTVAASSSPTTQESSAPAADPAKAQATELDKLLADSGGSRASVIRAVANVRQCDNLGQAASDLRAAAKQRTDLVTRLGKVSVDKLPDNAALTDALTKAWQASAAADNHYAAWADQVAHGGRKSCRKGHARGTGQSQAGDRASGTASSEKNKAAGLWNAIAKQYGLTQRQPTQL
ncbi:hypothetical protein ACGFYV_35655 [Streptomyces sp. NPDC048297]|uniref:hypothetical protein n=1 Tax=Streptomyces sp. NPDC048297 TaxID=3365531 RepID=UPI0037179CC9